ncbi:MAG: metal ABC transporter permease [Myxococcota bacterium]
MFKLLFDNWELYQDPILAASISGLVLGLLGVYVVSRRIVFVSAALSQTAALGVTLGFFGLTLIPVSGLLHDLLPPFLAIVLCFALVFALTTVGESESMGRDAVLGIAFIVPTAIVLIIGPHIAQEMHEIEAILHGSAVLVRELDLWAVGIAGALVIATQLVAFRGFVFASLDPVVARVQGLPVSLLDAVLFGSIALMTGLVTRALGALPTFALTVLPAVGALGLRVGLRNVFVLAALGGAIAGGGGYVVAFAMDWSVGATQTLMAGAVALIMRGVGKLQ